MTFMISVLLGLIVCLILFVRLMPSDPARFHVALGFEIDGDQPGGAERILDGNQVASLDKVILATPRTVVLAGDPEAGHVTYVTRSKLWGFPDYTTVQFVDGHTRLWGRLRFGRSDLSVNAKRLKVWIDALGQG